MGKAKGGLSSQALSETFRKNFSEIHVLFYYWFGIFTSLPG
jgi:hypothetical protein